MRKLGRVAAVLAVTACAPVPDPVFVDLEYGLARYRGQPVNDLIAVLGFPDRQDDVAGRRFVRWSTERDVTTNRPVFTYGGWGRAGYGWGYGGMATTYVPTTVTVRCEITAEIDGRRRVISTEARGDRTGCRPFAEAFGPAPVQPAPAPG